MPLYVRRIVENQPRHLSRWPNHKISVSKPSLRQRSARFQVRLLPSNHHPHHPYLSDMLMPLHQHLRRNKIRGPLVVGRRLTRLLTHLRLRSPSTRQRAQSNSHLNSRATRIRQVAKVNESDVSAVDAMKRVIANLGFGNGAIKLYSGYVPIEFIREGNTLLAVQTNGRFAPGVRETLMIIARELGR